MLAHALQALYQSRDTYMLAPGPPHKGRRQIAGCVRAAITQI
jgi:hypothetical protein